MIHSGVTWLWQAGTTGTLPWFGPSSAFCVYYHQGSELGNLEWASVLFFLSHAPFLFFPKFLILFIYSNSSKCFKGKLELHITWVFSYILSSYRSLSITLPRISPARLEAPWRQGLCPGRILHSPSRPSKCIINTQQRRAIVISFIPSHCWMNEQTSLRMRLCLREVPPCMCIVFY